MGVYDPVSFDDIPAVDQASGSAPAKARQADEPVSFDDLPASQPPVTAAPAPKRQDSSGWGRTIATLGGIANPAMLPYAISQSDIPSEVAHEFTRNLSEAKKKLNPFDAEREQEYLNPQQPGDIGGGGLGRTGEGLAALGAAAISPLTGAYHSIVGHGLAGAEHALGEVINPEVAGKEDPEAMYEQAKQDADRALQLGSLAMAPEGGGLRPAVPVPPRPGGPLGVTLSRGQETSELPLIQREQAALRGNAGAPAQARAKQFFDQQQAQVEEAKERIAAGLDPAGQQVVTDPQEAGAVVSDALRDTEASRQAELRQQRAGLAPPDTLHPLDAADVVGQALRGSAEARLQVQARTEADLAERREALRSSLAPNGQVLAESPQDAAEIISAGVTRAEEQATEARDAAYANFAAQDGQFDPRTFRNIRNRVSQSLNAGDDPVILNDKTTPMGVAALNDLDETLGGAARTALDPETRAYRPFTPEYVDDIRKRLNAFSRQANASARATNDYSDVRAMKRITDAFDNVVQGGLRNPDLFSGDGSAVADAMSQARGLHAELRNTFSRQGSGDTVGPVMQKIIGQREGQAAPANQIAQWLYGAGQTPVLVGRRMMSLFGADSPEIGAVKQGLFSHVTERPNGVTAWGPEQVADRIYDFINGHGRALAQTYLSPAEQVAWRGYADRLRASAVAPVAQTDVVQRALDKINGIGGQAATQAELADTLFGRSGVGENPLGVKLAQHVRQTYGEDSDAFAALRRGMFSRLARTESGPLGFDPEAISGQIREFLGGRGRPMAQTLYSADEQAQLRSYADALQQYADRTAAPGTAIDRAVARISGADGNPPAQAKEVANMLYGRGVAQDRSLSVNLANRLKGQFGETSPQWSAVKQGLFRQLVEKGEGLADWGPKVIADRINNFLNVNGKELSNVVFSPEERDMLQAYADLHRKLEVPQTGANWSNNNPIIWTLNKIGGRIGMALGAALGFGAAHGAPFVGELGALAGAGMAAGAGKLAAKMEAKSAAKAVAKQLPLIADEMRQWQRASARAARLNTAPSQAAKRIAGANLTRLLKPLGIDFGGVAAAQQNGQKNNSGTNQPGSAQTDQPARAHGGSVRDSRPRRIRYASDIPGAKLARDGYHYVADPNRPGKYLRIVPRAAAAG